VSQNRRRYVDDQFNLDLTYISKRVIAMGFPGNGLKSFFRNSKSAVELFLKQRHSSQVKIYNLCNEDAKDLNNLEFTPDIKVAYFPMMDHNPGSIALLFHLVLDMVIFLS